MIIQTIGLDPTGAVWTDEASNVSSLDPSGADQIDAEHPSRNRKVVGSNPTSGSITAGQELSSKTSIFGVDQAVATSGSELMSVRFRAGPSGRCGRASERASRD
jgi:hypothetical protein